MALGIVGVRRIWLASVTHTQGCPYAYALDLGRAGAVGGVPCPVQSVSGLVR